MGTGYCPSPDPVLPDDGQRQQGRGVRKVVLGGPTRKDSPHSPKDVTGTMVAVLSGCVSSVSGLLPSRFLIISLSIIDYRGHNFGFC